MAGRATERLFSPLSASVKPRQALNYVTLLPSDSEVFRLMETTLLLPLDTIFTLGNRSL